MAGKRSQPRGSIAEKHSISAEHDYWVRWYAEAKRHRDRTDPQGPVKISWAIRADARVRVLLEKCLCEWAKEVPVRAEAIEAGLVAPTEAAAALRKLATAMLALTNRCR